MATLRVFVNGIAGDAAAGSTALEAVRAVDPAEASEVAAGRRAIVDSRGLPVESGAAAFAGCIYRTVRARAE
jgi:hypothetical protein